MHAEYLRACRAGDKAAMKRVVIPEAARILDSPKSADIMVKKRTNQPFDNNDVVKEGRTPYGNYAIIEADEPKEAYRQAAHFIQIETFVKAAEVSFAYIDTPCYLQPDAQNAKGRRASRHRRCERF